MAGVVCAGRSRLVGGVRARAGVALFCCGVGRGSRGVARVCEPEVCLIAARCCRLVKGRGMLAVEVVVVVVTLLPFCYHCNHFVTILFLPRV